MQTSMSMAHRYSSTKGRIPSRLRRPMTGSTSRWVRMRVVPLTTHLSSVRLARWYTSSAVNSPFSRATSPMASFSPPVREDRRSSMQDLSRWMCVSTNPAVTSLPATSITSASAVNSDSIAAMVPPDIPMSTSGASGPSLVLALRRIVSIAPLVPSVSRGDSGSVSLRYLARSSCRRRPGFGSCAATVAGHLWAH